MQSGLNEKRQKGVVMDNEDLKKQGKTDEKAGDVKKFLGDVKGKADDLVDDVKDKITKH